MWSALLVAAQVPLTYRDQLAYLEGQIADSRHGFITSILSFGLIGCARLARHLVGRLYSYPSDARSDKDGWVAFRPGQRKGGRLAVVSVSWLAAAGGLAVVVMELPSARFLEGGLPLYALLLGGAALFSGGRLGWHETTKLLTSVPGSRQVHPNVLFLRSFEDDALPAERLEPSLEDNMFPFPALRTVEDAILTPAKRYGAIVSLHNRGTPSARFVESLSVPDSSWQSEVVTLIRKSRVIVVLIGRTEGLAWEVEALAREGAVSRSIFFVPPVSSENKAERWTWLLDRLARSSPGVSSYELRAASTRAVELASGDGSNKLAAIRYERGVPKVYTSSRPGTRGYRELSAALIAEVLGGSEGTLDPRHDV